jgi:hypothetical protein
MDKDNLTDQKQVLFGFEPTFNYSLRQRISYFPTTRTSVYAGYQFTYSFHKRPRIIMSSETTNHSLAAKIESGASYFFSPQLQLNLTTWLDYDSLDYNALHYNSWNGELRAEQNLRFSGFHFYLNLSLRYTFF